MKQVRKAGHGRRWLVAGALAVTAAVCSVVALAQPAQAEDATTYTLYPTPQVMNYGEGTVVLAETADVYVGGDIDNYTVDRLDETLALKGMEKTTYDSVDALPFDGDTDVIVGVQGSDDGVEQYVEELGLTVEDGLFEKTDAYLLAFVPDTDTADARIVVLGKDTDSAFYGLTTVYQLFQQVEGYEVREFTMSDWADVVSRGFIEGYYGNPWSQEDREDLMRWGGYHKLNVYVYAPKDDLKHRLHWRQKYTDEEIEKIAALAEAGNESKCRFVYALLPFYKPGENGMDGNTEESLGTKVDAKFDLVNNYDADLEVLKARYLQVIDAGVRQIALLADDAWNQGGENYLRLLRDLTTWLEELQQLKNQDGSPKYPGLKTTIPYVGAQWTYTGTGESWYQQAPDNIQFVLTGGQTFGASSADFIKKVQAATGRNPFMWINWPCTDPLPNYLTMGGHNTFLKSDVQPGSLDGIMLNPMQQSQPSKQGIFMVSDYAWNLWDNEDHADQVWQDSFSYMENNSPNATEASDALRELSSHMRMSTAGTTAANTPKADYTASVPGQTRQFSFWINDESKDFSGETNPAATMDALKDAVEAGTVDAQTIADARATYQRIVDAANTYESKHTNDEMWEQIEPFVKALRDKAQASLLYLDVIEASNGKNADAASALLAQAEKTHAASTSYTYNQLGTNYEARAGHEYVEPTLNALRTYASDAVGKASTEVDRESMSASAGSEVEDSHVGNTEGKVDFAIDGKNDTFWGTAWDTSPAEDDLWIQLELNEAASVASLRYLPRQTTGDIMTAGSANGTVTEYQVLYSNDGVDWEIASEGTWPDYEDKSWRTAAFDSPVTAKYFRLKAVESFVANNQGLNSMTAAEVRLVLAPSVDYSDLVETVVRAEALDTSGKTAESVSALEQAIAEARALYVNSNADATQIAAAVSKLNDAIAGLTDEPTTYTVTFVGAQGITDQTVEEGKTATEPTVTAPAGYTFGGWFLGGEKYDFNTPVNSNITLTASWTLNAPTVSLTADQAAPVEGDTVTLTATASHPGADVKLTYAWAKGGETIDGETGSTLAVTENGTYTVTVTATDPDKATATATADIKVTFSAKPEPTPETHTVTVVLGNGEANLTFEVKDGERLAEPAAPKRDGYTFAGWFTTVDPATGELSNPYFFTEPVTDDLTVYAGWCSKTTGQQPGQPTTPDPDDSKGDQAGDKPQGNGVQRPAQGGSDGTLAKTGDPASLAAVLATAIAGAGAVVASCRRR